MADSLDNMNISKLKVSELKRELKARGLNYVGNKTELVERLMEAMSNNKNDDHDGSADSVDELIDEDDVLNDEEIEEEVGNMKNIELEVSDKSFEIENNTDSSKPVKRKISAFSTTNSTEEVKSAKKIVLNRNLSTDTETIPAVISPNTTNGNTTQEKKVVKLSELSAKERLEMRAKKFGVALSASAKKEVRAARFGENNSSTTATGKATITLNNTPNLDQLKKRAERFGTVSTQLAKVEVAEKLEQRKARFGAASATTTNGSTNQDQKAKRLERFKTT